MFQPNNVTPPPMRIATGGKPHYYSLTTRAREFGYLPVLTSLQGILEETKKVLPLF